MTWKTSFRSYSDSDREACLAIFDANCPLFFAPNERKAYRRFLDTAPDGYEVCEVAGRKVAAFGRVRDDVDNDRLVWIMLEPDSQGEGIGSVIMRRVISSAKASNSRRIRISASHKSAPFFARFGAVATVHTRDGWGPGMDRVDMEIAL